MPPPIRGDAPTLLASGFATNGNPVSTPKTEDTSTSAPPAPPRAPRFFLEGPNLLRSNELALKRPALVPKSTPLAQAPKPLTNQTILIFFNPAARGGRNRAEMPQVEAHLKAQGAQVEIIETPPEPSVRSYQMQAKIQSQVALGTPVVVIPWGGDGTIGEVAEAVHSMRHGRHLVSLALVPRGTAGDLAMQVGSPHASKSLGDFLGRAVRLPIDTPILTNEAARRGLAIHSTSLGIGGDLFARRAQNLAQNPQSFWNQGVGSYLRLIPYAMQSAFARGGLDYEISIERNGKTTTQQFRGAEAMVTPSRVVAHVSANAGLWGKAKLQLLPHGLRGFLVFSDLVARGLITRGLGINLARADSPLLFGQEYQKELLPGDKVTIQVRLPDTPLWNKLISTQPIGYAQNFARTMLPLASSGKPYEIPRIINGDLLGPLSELKVEIPKDPSRIFLLAHPQSLAVNLSTKALVLADTPNHQEVRTRLFNTRALHQLASRHGIPLDQIPALLAQAQGIQRRSDSLTTLANLDLNLPKVELLLEKPSRYNQQWLNYYRRYSKAFSERFSIQGVPLVLSFATYGATEVGLKYLDIDFGGDPLLHFGAVTYLTHGVQQNITPLWQMTARRWLRASTDYVIPRTLHLKGVSHTQFTMARHHTWAQAAWGAWSSSAGYLGPGAHYSTGLKIFRGALLPLRAGLNMGLGMSLAMGAQSLAEVLLADEPENSWSKKYVPTLAGFTGFATPTLTHIISPRAGQIFQHPYVRGASLLMGAAFLTDLAFSSWSGGLSHQENTLGLRLIEAQGQSGKKNLLQQGLRALAPSLASYLASHESIFGIKNKAYRELETQDRVTGKNLMATLAYKVPALLKEVGWSREEALGKRQKLSPLEKRIAEDLAHWMEQEEDLDELALRLRRNYSGYDFSQQEAKACIARILISGIQDQIGMAQALQLPHTGNLYKTFDRSGVLRPEKNS